MKLSPTTLLVLIMFGSFTVILAAMVVMFRPAARPSQPKIVRTRPQKPSDEPRIVSTDTGQVSRIAARPETTLARSEKPKHPKKTPTGTQPSNTSSKLYRELQHMRKEVARQKTDLEKRLNNEIQTQDKKLTQMARWCEPLEPGEAVQLLQKLDDETIARVLRRMNNEKALPIAALLKRLGREKAIALK